MAYDMTLKCAESLLALPVPVRLVIVDNASPDGSGELLRDRFAASPSVTVILNESNEGFARGNNAGYKYLRDHFHCRFITVLNNDVLIKDRDFTAKV
ncbi:MAG: glycosyltransferase, partial [Bacteroidales bacterium]|nr:glycosyltransferase [Bacteroidales bacterium]